MPDSSRSGRIDFVVEFLSVDSEAGIVKVAMKPDPRRYEWQHIDGERYLYDKLDHARFPEQFVHDLAKQMAGMPLYGQPAQIDDAQQYIASRRSAIRAMLDGTQPAPRCDEQSGSFLDSLDVHKLAFVILCLDIHHSTALATSISPQLYVRLISTVLYELSEVVPLFHGHVLKYTGDGLIAYFPEPSFITKNDLALDCALTMHGLVYTGLNPVLTDCDLPALEVRIGVDAGEAYIEPIGSPKTKRHRDIIGTVVSLASKIQSLAPPGDIYLGDVALRHLHTGWRQLCQPVELPAEWEYKYPAGKAYRVHKAPRPPWSSGPPPNLLET